MAEADILSKEIIQRAPEHKDIIGNRGEARKSNLMDKKLDTFKVLTGDRIADKLKI